MNIVGISALIGSILYALVSIEYSLILRKSGIVFLPAFLFSAIWVLTPTFIYTFDFIHVALWSASFLLIFHQNKQLETMTMRWALLWAIPGLSLFGAFYTTMNANLPTQFHFYLYLLCCIGMLLISEQLIRNSSGLIKAIGIGIGALFLYNLYFYSSALIMGQISVEIVQARGLANTSVGVMLFIAPMVFSSRDYRRKKLSLSRPLVFTTTSLVVAGSILLVVSVLGYLLRIGGEQYAVMEPFFLFLGILLIGFNLGTSTRRARTRVWINKHFFQTKFDYNAEWRNLSDRLTLTSTSDDYASIALHAVLPIYNGTAAVCFLLEGDDYRPVQQLNVPGDVKPINCKDNAAFVDKMLKGYWMYLPATTDSGLSKFNHLIPPEIQALDSVFLILPLVSNDALIGFITITADIQQTDNFDWEDLDLMRMVGKQLSNFIAYQMLTNELIVTRQFEAFNQFTTFIMHDLKNLIAQQALVVKNAARFIDNPDFVADAINTIENSVDRMSKLLAKLTQNTSFDLASPQVQATSLDDVLQRALLRCEGKKPLPVLIPAESDSIINADPDTLVMAFTHLLNNSQEACHSDGSIQIELTRLGEEVECKITDNGGGMEQDFIDHRLFKPFDSTKKNQGMGIGAYQYKQIISNIGGRISVTSKIGEGSCFTVTLPLSEQNN